MKRRLLVLAMGVLMALAGVMVLMPKTVLAQATDDCVHQPTIASLQTCVRHAASEGFITNQGITTSLIAKLDAAQAALDRGQTGAAIHQLEAFEREVQAQSGKHIDPTHAQHLLAHAQLVIEALQQS